MAIGMSGWVRGPNDRLVSWFISHLGDLLPT